ncbi:hypothetical protein ABKV27_16400 [Enterobacter hormaechei]
MSDIAVTAASQGIDWFKYISPVASVIVSTGITYWFFVARKKDENLSYLNKEISDILKISMAYPHCEYKEFCDSWDPVKAKDGSPEAIKYLQYNIYTTLVFNYASSLCSHFKYNEDKFLQHTDIKSWIRLHKKAWKQPLNDENENIDTYEREFIEIVNRYIG